MSALRSVAILAAALFLAAPAGAVGPPIGASPALSDTAYTLDGRHAVIVDQGERGTTVRLVDARTRRVERRWAAQGRWGLPRVTATQLGGLDAHGSTLVLADAAASPFDSAITRFLVVDLRRPTRPHLVRLSGAFGFDALSPSGDRLYLVQGASRPNGSPGSQFDRYLVRVYDLRTGRLARRAIFDQRDGPGAMQGIATARAASPDGSWVYTLYLGGAHAFVHALHASAAEARCIDLPWTGTSTDRQIVAYLDRKVLTLSDERGAELARIDTSSLRVQPVVDPTV